MPITMGMVAGERGRPIYLADQDQAYTTSTTPTMSHTCNSRTDCLIVVVGIHAGDGGSTISSVTYNGVALTSAINDESNSGSSTAMRCAIFYLKNPLVGSAANIVATLTGDVTHSWLNAIDTRGIGLLSATDSDANAASDTTGVGTLADASPRASFIVGGTAINAADSTIVWTSDGPSLTETYGNVVSAFSFSTAYAEQTATGATIVTATHSSASRPAAVFARFA